MVEKRIAVKLQRQLERERRGLCDPEEPRNSEVISSLNYGARGYLRVYPSRFIQAQIEAGVLVRVPEAKTGGGGGTVTVKRGHRKVKARKGTGEGDQ